MKEGIATHTKDRVSYLEQELLNSYKKTQGPIYKRGEGCRDRLEQELYK